MTSEPRLGVGVASFNHILAFSYLTAALQMAHFERSGWRPVILWMLAYGIGPELIQSVLPAREAEIQDVGMDGVGILIGSALYQATRRLRGGIARHHAGSSERQASPGDARSEP